MCPYEHSHFCQISSSSFLKCIVFEIDDKPCWGKQFRQQKKKQQKKGVSWHNAAQFALKAYLCHFKNLCLLLIPIRQIGSLLLGKPILKRARAKPCWHVTTRQVRQDSYLFCAVKVSLCRCGPLYTTLLSPWLARAPSVRAMEPMAEGWKRGEENKICKLTFLQQQTKCFVCVSHLMVHRRFGEGRDGER